MSKKATKSEQQHHFFVTSPFNWQTADTQEEAIKVLLSRLGKEELKLQIEHYGNLPINSFKVNVPKSVNYSIDNRRPTGVDMEPIEQLLVTDVKGTIVRRNG